MDSERILTQLRVEGYDVSPNCIDIVAYLETNKVLTVGVQVVVDIIDGVPYSWRGAGNSQKKGLTNQPKPLGK